MNAFFRFFSLSFLTSAFFFALSFHASSIPSIPRIPGEQDCMVCAMHGLAERGRACMLVFVLLEKKYLIYVDRLQCMLLCVVSKHVACYLLTQNYYKMENYYDLILQGAKLAKTPKQQATVEYYAKGIQTKLKNIDRMLTELEKPDPRWDHAKATSARLARLLK